MVDAGGGYYHTALLTNTGEVYSFGFGGASCLLAFFFIPFISFLHIFKSCLLCKNCFVLFLKNVFFSLAQGRGSVDKGIFPTSQSLSSFPI